MAGRPCSRWRALTWAVHHADRRGQLRGWAPGNSCDVLLWALSIRPVFSTIFFITVPLASLFRHFRLNTHPSYEISTPPMICCIPVYILHACLCFVCEETKVFLAPLGGCHLSENACRHVLVGDLARRRRKACPWNSDETLSSGEGDGTDDRIQIQHYLESLDSHQPVLHINSCTQVQNSRWHRQARGN